MAFFFAESLRIHPLLKNQNTQVGFPSNGNGGNPTSGGNTPVGGGAPIGGGLLILVALGASYGAKKVYDFKKRQLAE